MALTVGTLPWTMLRTPGGKPVERIGHAGMLIIVCNLTSSFTELSDHHCSARVSLGRFQNESVTGNSGQRDRPQRNHPRTPQSEATENGYMRCLRWEIERSDAVDSSARISGKLVSAFN